MTTMTPMPIRTTTTGAAAAEAYYTTKMHSLAVSEDKGKDVNGNSCGLFGGSKEIGNYKAHEVAREKKQGKNSS